MTHKHEKEQSDFQDQLREDLSDQPMSMQDAELLRQIQQTDPMLQDMLGEAMADQTDTGYLEDMILEKTLPAFQSAQPQPFYRINPQRVRKYALVAATVMVGLTIFAVARTGLMRDITTTNNPLVSRADGITLDELDSKLASIAVLEDQSGLDVAGEDSNNFTQRLDSELELLAVQMEMMNIDAGIQTEEEVMDSAAFQYEMQQLGIQNEMYF